MTCPCLETVGYTRGQEDAHGQSTHQGEQVMSNYYTFVGLDVRKDTIAVATAHKGKAAPDYHGVIKNDVTSLRRLLTRLSPDGEVISYCYEAGPCGYGIYREITKVGHHRDLVAPSLIPRGSGDRVKTDRRDAVKLAKLHRSGMLQVVWVPGLDQEAMRDLTRAREDMKGIERKSRQRLGAFLLRHDRNYSGRSKWTAAHAHWLEKQSFDHPVQQVVFQEYVDAVQEASRRVAGLEAQIHAALKGWGMRPFVEALIPLRGIGTLTAVTIIAELGDITRFDNPGQLMSYLGLVPSERSSGGQQRRGGITNTGNGHVRRLLVESAWNYRHPARKTAHLRRKGAVAPPNVHTLAWVAQKRLCARYQYLSHSRKPGCKVATAIARELTGYIWAIAREMSGMPHGSRSLA